MPRTAYVIPGRVGLGRTWRQRVRFRFRCRFRFRFRLGTSLDPWAPASIPMGGARACARAPPFVTFSIAKTLKNVSGKGFLRVLGGRGKVF